MSDRELLELAAMASGYEPIDYYNNSLVIGPDYNKSYWNPLTDDGDAFRLAVKLQIVSGKYDDYASACSLGNPVVGEVTVWGHEEQDPAAAVRRAIVRAAAEIGKGMK